MYCDGLLDANEAIVKDNAVKGYYVVQPYYNEEAGAIMLGFTLLFYGGHFAMTIACWQVPRRSH